MSTDKSLSMCYDRRGPCPLGGIRPIRHSQSAFARHAWHACLYALAGPTLMLRVDIDLYQRQVSQVVSMHALPCPWLWQHMTCMATACKAGVCKVHIRRECSGPQRKVTKIRMLRGPQQMRWPAATSDSHSICSCGLLTGRLRST
jgi:hypothetical protein